MFDEAQPQLERILVLVKLCPEHLQEKCFELLLNAYLESVTSKQSAKKLKSDVAGEGVHNKDITSNGGAVIPDVIKTRFNSLVARTKVSAAKAADLFDFGVDPFTFHAFAVPGASNREKMRNIALLLCIKGYLISAAWVADWKEFRATCIDHNCWDQSNMSTIMKHDWFKTVSAGANINLGPAGQKAAEGLFAKLSGGDEPQT